jgi:hypothetical protein
MSIFNAFKVVGQALKVLTVTEGVLELSDTERQPDDDRPAAHTPDSQIDPREEQTMGEEEARTLVEVIEIEGKELVKRVKELIHEGNIRKLTIRDSGGKYLLEVPLTVGIVAGGVLALASPIMTALSAVAGFVANVQIEVVRIEEESEAGEETEDTADEPADDA